MNTRHAEDGGFFSCLFISVSVMYGIMEKVIADLDWVKERNNCSLAMVFEKLKSEVLKDVEKRKDQLQASKSKYSLDTSVSNDELLVVREKPTNSGIEHTSISFVLNSHEIKIQRNQRDELFTVGLTLNNDGDCKLLIGDKELYSWQVRRMALEQLLFNLP